MKETSKRLYESRGYRIALVALILAAGGFVAYEFLFVRSPSESFLQFAVLFDTAISVAFLTDYALGLWISATKRKYIFSWAGMLNLVSSVPYPIGILQGLRVLKFSRVLQGFRLARTMRGVRIGMQGESVHLRQNGKGSASSS